MSPGSCSSDSPQTPKLKTRKHEMSPGSCSSDRPRTPKLKTRKHEMSPGSCSSDRPRTPKLKTRKQMKCHLVVALLTDLEHQNSKQENRRNVTW